MTLDDDTRAALGFGDAWEQLALRWPLYVVASTRKDWRKGRRTTTKPIASSLTTEQRRVVSRRAARGHSPADIAHAVGASPKTVIAYLSKRRAA